MLKNFLIKVKFTLKKREKFILCQHGSIGRNVPKICAVYKRPKYLCFEEDHLKDGVIFLALIMVISTSAMKQNIINLKIYRLVFRNLDMT